MDVCTCAHTSDLPAQKPHCCPKLSAALRRGPGDSLLPIAQNPSQKHQCPLKQSQAKESDGIKGGETLTTHPQHLGSSQGDKSTPSPDLALRSHPHSSGVSHYKATPQMHIL